MQKARLIVAVVLLAGGLVALGLLVVLLAWNSLAGPWIGGASFLTLLVLFVIGALSLVGAVFLLIGLRKKRI